jgi:hypothetical protein
MHSRSQGARGPAKSQKPRHPAGAADDCSAASKSDHDTSQTTSVHKISTKHTLPSFDDFFPDAATQEVRNDDA